MRYKLSTIFFLVAVLCAVFALPHPGQSAIYTREYTVSTSTDDADERTSGDYLGQVDNNAEDLDLEVGYLVGVRFQGVQVPQGATILNAYIEFTAQDPDIDSYRVTIKGEASDNPLAFEEVDFNISSRDKTSATVTWSDSASWVVGDQYQTPDIKSIVQEIVNRLGWVNGNSMVFLLLGEDDERDAETYEHNQAKAALLHIEFSSLNTHTITASAGYGGSISPPGQVTVLDGDSETFSIIPDPGNSIHDVLVDGISQVPPSSSYTFDNVTTDHYITALFNLPTECSDLSSVPLSAIKHAAPANIMFMLDDSGSMDWEFLTEENDGKFQNEIDRKKWKSQWAGYNKLYYDPSVDYEPWPTLNDADPDTPRSHPINAAPTFALNDTYYLLDHGIIVDNLDGPPSYTETGTWNPVPNHHESYDNHFWECSSDANLHTATWTPNLAAGDYNVYAWWRSYGDYSTAVPYTINHLGGPSTVPPVDQTQNEKQWNSLGGPYTFDGVSGDVTISYTPSGSGTDLVCADAVKFVSTGATIIDIKNAHYYTFVDANANSVYDAGDTVYLVVIEGTGGTYTIRYYQATVTGSGATEEVTDLVEVTGPSIPASVESTRTPAEERQNFANWYSFYRRRVLTATGAVANAIVNMQGVNVGMYSINKSLIRPVLSVKANGEDHTATLLNSLYNLTLVGDT
jgi:hypothetical protein